MNVLLTKGSIGQLQGPFTITDVIYFNNVHVKLGISIDEKDLMSYNDEFIFAIDGENIKIGREGMYETDDPVRMNTLWFPEGAPASVLVEYVILDV